jgi:hypothetical protein
MIPIKVMELKVHPNEKPRNDYSFRDDASANVVNVSHSNRSPGEGDHHNDPLVPLGKMRSCDNVEEDPFPEELMTGRRRVLFQFHTH